MSASNFKCGFTVPQGPKEKLSVSEAKKRFEDGLKELDQELKELKILLNELEEVVK